MEPDIQVPQAQALAAAHLEALKALNAKSQDPKEQARYAWTIEALEAARSPTRFTAKELGAFAGTYGPRKFWIEQDKLVQQRDGRPKLTLVPLTGTTFAPEGVDDARFTFVKDGKGIVTKVVLTYDNGDRDEDARTR